jgi:cullin-associated NEDD8-dissociated protein 1
MGAAMAAVMLDSEARSSILDADPTYGKFREPLLKVLHMMRAMEFTSVDNRDVHLSNMQLRIGQDAFTQPSVFNFYLGEYSPPGPLGDLALLAPESQISTAPMHINFLNSMTKFIDEGLKRTNFGDSLRSDSPEGDGKFEYASVTPHNPDAVVDELAMLLTEGRLDNHNRKVIAAEYAKHEEDLYAVELVDHQNNVNLVQANSSSVANRTMNDTGVVAWLGGEGDLAVAELALSGGVDACTTTTMEKDPWWVVDLGAVYEVRSVVISQGDKFYTEFVTDIDVYLDGVKCAANVNETLINYADRRSKEVPCVGTGSVVRIQLNGVAPLVLCQVQVKAALKTSALKHAQKMFLATSEFHTTNLNRAKPEKRPEPTPQVAFGRPYKAVVIMFLNGGCDSYSLLMPHSKCNGTSVDLYQEYAEVRGPVVAIPKADLLELDVPKGTQPCDKMGLHPSLKTVHQLYKDGDAALLANHGSLVEPITKAQLTARGGATRRTPLALYSHNGQQRAFATVDAGNSNADGVLGRMVKELTAQEKPYKSALYSMVGNQRFLQGSGPHVSPDIVGSTGIQRFGSYEDVKEGFDAILEQDSGSLFSQTFSEVLQTSLDKTEFMGALVQNVNQTSNYTVDPANTWSKQLHEVAKMMKLDATVLQNERAAYITSAGGYDSHFFGDLSPQFDILDAGLNQFVTELKAQELWNNVTILLVSDFGRTITSNSQGTDHSWGGNYFMLGGDVKGGQIHGKYPARLDKEFSDEVFSSRVMPTASWDAVWHGIAGWWDVANSSIAEILPNVANFAKEGDHIGVYSRSQLFDN